MASSVLVSACLLGVRCRYDGQSARDHALIERLTTQWVVPVCPEQLGGLPTPRAPSELHGGDGRDVLAGRAQVISSDGADVTDSFCRGAEESCRLARVFGSKVAYLKSKSPSCGKGRVKIDGQWQAGDGVCVAALEAEGVRVVRI